MYSVIIYNIEIIVRFFPALPHEAYFNIVELTFHIRRTGKRV